MRPDNDPLAAMQLAQKPEHVFRIPLLAKVVPGDALGGARVAGKPLLLAVRGEIVEDAPEQARLTLSQCADERWSPRREALPKTRHELQQHTLGRIGERCRDLRRVARFRERPPNVG